MKKTKLKNITGAEVKVLVAIAAGLRSPSEEVRWLKEKLKNRRVK